MAEFAYNNTKNASTGYISFKLNCKSHPRVSYKENFNPRLKSRAAKELSFKFQELMTVCQQNFHYVQKL